VCAIASMQQDKKMRQEVVLRPLCLEG